VVQRLLPPLNVPDYGSYIAQIKRDVDAVYAGFAARNGFRFLRQYREYGLKLPVLGSMTTADEGILRQMGDEAHRRGLGRLVRRRHRFAAKNKRFVAAVNKEYGADPGYYTLGAYSAGALVEAAARAVGRQGRGQGRVHEGAAQPGTVRDRAANGSSTSTAIGHAGYIRKVERRGGKLVNTVVQTLPRR
jgi:branched-chain amino acid transport system substrate-binding protein